MASPRKEGAGLRGDQYYPPPPPLSTGGTTIYSHCHPRPSLEPLCDPPLVSLLPFIPQDQPRVCSLSPLCTPLRSPHHLFLISLAFNPLSSFHKLFFFFLYSFLHFSELISMLYISICIYFCTYVCTIVTDESIHLCITWRKKEKIDEYNTNKIIFE